MFSKATHYALWGLVYTQMQNFNGVRPGIKDIAREIEAPPLSVAKIFQSLVRHGFIVSLKGKSGGFYFDKNKPELTIKELIHATLDDKIITNCFLGIINCSPQNPCPVHGQWKTISESIERLVSTVTIQKLAWTYSTFKNSKELELSNL